MTAPTPYPAPYPYSFPAPLRAPAPPRTPGVAEAARIVACVQAGLCAVFGLVVAVFVLPWAAATEQEDRRLLTSHGSTHHTLVLTLVALGFAVVTAVSVGVSAACLRAGGRRAHATLLTAELVTTVVAIGLAVSQHSRGWGLLSGFHAVLAVVVIAFAVSPDSLRWARS